MACDVSKPADVERLANTAAEELGQIDIWVCNAGQSARAKTPVAQCSAAELQAGAVSWFCLPLWFGSGSTPARALWLHCLLAGLARMQGELADLGGSA